MGSSLFIIGKAKGGSVSPVPVVIYHVPGFIHSCLLFVLRDPDENRSLIFIF